MSEGEQVEALRGKVAEVRQTVEDCISLLAPELAQDERSEHVDTLG